MSIREFVAESNRIEGIHRVMDAEVEATEKFLALPMLTVQEVSALVSVYAPHAKLRESLGMNVIVGEHVPIPGGPRIPILLEALLGAINSHSYTPYEGHIRYETLHPFMDGNGRSGRGKRNARTLLLQWLQRQRQAPNVADAMEEISGRYRPD